MLPIAESELFITTKGSIYHLDLAPEQLATTVITVGDPRRVGAVSRYFDRIEHQEEHREFITHTGYVGRKRISVVSTGIGTDNVDIVLNELDALANINFETRIPHEQRQALSIIRLGTSGAMRPEIAVDSYVVASHGLGLDNLMHYYRFHNDEAETSILKDFIAHTGLHEYIVPYISAGSSTLGGYFKAGFTHGITVTSPGFYGPQGRTLHIPLAYPTLVDSFTSFRSGEHVITNCEMETSAIYGLGRMMGHHCLSINTIVNNRVSKRFSADMPKAIDKMIRQTLEIIEKT